MAEGEEPSQSDAIDQQLADARAELAALERAVEELPHIFEAKFRQGVAAVVETNRDLYRQQQLLQQQCAAQLPPARRPWRWPPRLQRRAVATLGATALLVGLGVAARWLWLMRPQSQLSSSQSQATSRATKPAATAQPSTLVLRASGTSWVEVQDLASREVIFIGLLEAGQQRTMPLKKGLRLRSGRPDLLSLQIGNAPPIPLDQNQGLAWRTVLPPELRTAGA